MAILERLVWFALALGNRRARTNRQRCEREEMTTNVVIDHYYAVENPHLGELCLLIAGIILILAVFVFLKLFKKKNSN
jgi:hypothetical protein